MIIPYKNSLINPFMHRGNPRTNLKRRTENLEHANERRRPMHRYVKKCIMCKGRGGAAAGRRPSRGFPNWVTERRTGLTCVPSIRHLIDVQEAFRSRPPLRLFAAAARRKGARRWAGAARPTILTLWPAGRGKHREIPKESLTVTIQGNYLLLTRSIDPRNTCTLR